MHESAQGPANPQTQEEDGWTAEHHTSETNNQNNNPLSTNKDNNESTTTGQPKTTRNKIYNKQTTDNIHQLQTTLTKSYSLICQFEIKICGLWQKEMAKTTQQIV